MCLNLTKMPVSRWALHLQQRRARRNPPRPCATAGQTRALPPIVQSAVDQTRHTPSQSRPDSGVDLSHFSGASQYSWRESFFRCKSKNMLASRWAWYLQGRAPRRPSRPRAAAGRTRALPPTLDRLLRRAYPSPPRRVYPSRAPRRVCRSRAPRRACPSRGGPVCAILRPPGFVWGGSTGYLSRAIWHALGGRSCCNRPEEDYFSQIFFTGHFRRLFSQVIFTGYLIRAQEEQRVLALSIIPHTTQECKNPYPKCGFLNRNVSKHYLYQDKVMPTSCLACSGLEWLQRQAKTFTWPF